MITHVRSNPTLIGIALLALAFITGVGVGVATDRAIARRSAGSTRVIQDMSGVLDQLSLTGEQRRQAQLVLDRAAPRSQRAMLELAARLRSISDSVDVELRAILTPEQRVKLDALKRSPTFVLKLRDSSGSSKVDTVYPATGH